VWHAVWSAGQGRWTADRAIATASIANARQWLGDKMKSAFYIFFISVLLIVSVSGYGKFEKPHGSSKVESSLESMMSSRMDEDVRVTIFLNEKNYSRLNLTDKEIIYGFDSMPAVTAQTSIMKLEEIEKLPQVERIVLDKKAYISRSVSIPLIKADVADALGYNGSGVNISVVDSGVFDHTEFINPNRIILQKCYCIGCCPNGANEDINATDDNGHGTHCAGIAAGKQGVANGSSIIAVKVLDSSGAGWDSDVAKGIEYAFQNGAKVISLSLGGCVNSSVSDYCYDSCYDSSTSRMVENAVGNGTVVIAAAGNCGELDFLLYSLSRESTSAIFLSDGNFSFISLYALAALSILPSRR